MWKQFIVTAGLFVLSTPLAHTQEAQSGALTNTGATTERSTADIAAAIRALAPLKNPTKLKDVIVPEIKEKAWVNESATTRKRQAEHRAECREVIRRANRDELMVRARQCYRSDLLLDVTMLRNQLQYITSIPSLSASIKASATGAILHQIDAEMAIVDAIDTGIFNQIEQLEETKRNLTTNYRQPTWLALTKIRADRELTWAIFMLKNIEARADYSDPESENAVLLKEIVSCLETGTITITQSISSVDRQNASQNLRIAQDLLQSCRHKIQDLAKRDRAGHSEKSDNDSSQQ